MYTRVNWEDLPSTDTPINATNLNKMDEGIYNLDTQMSKKVETEYLGQNPDINSKRSTAGIYGLYGCTQAPDTGIGILEVLIYTEDWVIQRFTTVGVTPRMWERAYYSGSTWGNWIQRW